MPEGRFKVARAGGQLGHFFPGHRKWIWCVRNYLASGSQPNSLVSPEAASFLQSGELEEMDVLNDAINKARSPHTGSHTTAFAW